MSKLKILSKLTLIQYYILTIKYFIRHEKDLANNCSLID